MHYAAFVSRLHDFVGEDEVPIIERWAGDEPKETLEQHAKDLVKQNVDVIVAAGGPQTVIAVQGATTKIPIVFTPVTHPATFVGKNLDHPNANLTGIAGMTSELDVTRLQLLGELLGGKAATIGVLSNKNRPHFEQHLKTLDAEASKQHMKLVPMNVENLEQIEQAFKSFANNKPDGYLVTADSLFNDLRRNVVGFAKGVPAIYQWREFAEAGGLMSFGANIIEAYRRVGEYVGHILDGATPGELPVSFPDKFELVINLRVAQADGPAIPASLLTRAEFVHTRLRSRMRSHR
jgi:putative ABC transport system substrate-binding protein